MERVQPIRRHVHRDAEAGGSTTSLPLHSSSTRVSAPTIPLFFLHAALAGVCGALSGVVGKAAVEATRVPLLAAAAIASLRPGAPPEDAAVQQLQLVVSWLLRLLLFLLNAVFTGAMWRFYLKALAQGSTPVCQILNTGTNFIVSAIAGLVFFGEAVTLLWACGALLTVVGLALVVTDPAVRA